MADVKPLSSGWKWTGRVADYVFSTVSGTSPGTIQWGSIVRYAHPMGQKVFHGHSSYRAAARRAQSKAWQGKRKQPPVKKRILTPEEAKERGFTLSVDATTRKG